MDEVSIKDMPSLEELQTIAKMEGINHHPNLGQAKLYHKIKAFKENNLIPDPNDVKEKVVVTDAGKLLKVKEAEERLNSGEDSSSILLKQQSKQVNTMRERARASAMQRVIVTCMNPIKGDYRGEIFKARNHFSGAVTRFISYSGEPQHIEQILLNVLSEKVFQAFVTKEDSRGNKYRAGVQRQEYTIVYLDKLSDKEVTELVEAQALNGSIQR